MGKARIFYIAADNVNIQGCYFVNGYTTSNGGAIYGDNVVNITFMYNYFDSFLVFYGCTEILLPYRNSCTLFYCKSTSIHCLVFDILF